MIAVDTSVLIDLLGEDPRADAAEACLRMALGSGPVVVCEVVVSEVTAALGQGSEVMDIGSYGDRSHAVSVRLSPVTIKASADPTMTLEKFWQTKKCLAVWEDDPSSL